MEVRALSTGFYGGSRRREGEVFDVKDGDEAKWFEPVDPEAAAAKGKGKGKAKTKAKVEDKVEAKVETTAETKTETEAADLA